MPPVSIPLPCSLCTAAMLTLLGFDINRMVRLASLSALTIDGEL